LFEYGEAGNQESIANQTDQAFMPAAILSACQHVSNASLRFLPVGFPVLQLAILYIALDYETVARLGGIGTTSFLGVPFFGAG
jgi:hypothetical protein